ncbi:dTMP kinase [Leeia aquatica]|uniref:Thymidylate kinase n=1 Tax=Leeia aquatica TaxID=2725557 RepID=A0A847RW05_9NEIS|nr:dTMP kinase [Leeia aquatica]NLR75360.1 dTMP kinase [Leeia aquatica]
MAGARGQFISLEGVDGAGKTTHLHWLVQFVAEREIPHVVSREPGGTPLAEKLRELLLHDSMSMDTEALLLFAARQQHLDELVRPQLAQGNWVICDRFTDASYAYQCGGRGLPAARLAVLEQWVHADLQPDLTLLFDVPPEVSYERVRMARDPDRFEQQDIEFFRRVRNAYLQRAAADPGRFCIVDANRSLHAIQQELQHVMEAYCDRHAR